MDTDALKQFLDEYSFRELYLARCGNSALILSGQKPTQLESRFGSGVIWDSEDQIMLKPDMFPEVTVEKSPVKVKLLFDILWEDKDES